MLKYLTICIALVVLSSCSKSEEEVKYLEKKVTNQFSAESLIGSNCSATNIGVDIQKVDGDVTVDTSLTEAETGDAQSFTIIGANDEALNIVSQNEEVTITTTNSGYIFIPYDDPTDTIRMRSQGHMSITCDCQQLEGVCSTSSTASGGVHTTTCSSEDCGCCSMTVVWVQDLTSGGSESVNVGPGIIIECDENASYQVL